MLGDQSVFSASAWYAAGMSTAYSEEGLSKVSAIVDSKDM